MGPRMNTSDGLDVGKCSFVRDCLLNVTSRVLKKDSIEMIYESWMFGLNYIISNKDWAKYIQIIFLITLQTGNLILTRE